MAKIKGEGKVKGVYPDEYGEGKRCPFLSVRINSTAVCIENECRLWIEEKSECALVVLALKN